MVHIYVHQRGTRRVLKWVQLYILSQNLIEQSPKPQGPLSFQQNSFNFQVEDLEG